MFLQQIFYRSQFSRSLTRVSIWLFLVFLTGNTYSQQDLLPPIVIDSEIEAWMTNWTDLASAHQRTVRLEPNAVLLVKDKELTIRARRLDVSPGAKIIAFKEPAQSGADGVNASDPHGKKSTTNGLNAGKVSIEINELDGNLLIDLRGQNGGRGGDGYRGDDGSNAQWGITNRRCVGCCHWYNLFCSKDMVDDYGWVSGGGKGGPGGDAGLGSDAGKGGTLEIKVKDDLNGCLTVSVGSGALGQPGTPGAGGVGGQEPGPSPNQLNPPLPQKHGPPGKPNVAGAINSSGSAQLLSLASLKPQRDQLRKKINDLSQQIAESRRIALGNQAQLSQFPHYRDWLTRQTIKPWSLFDPFRHGASEEGQRAFTTLLQNPPQLSGSDIELLQTIRDQYIQFIFNNNQANLARENISQYARDKENAATKELPALEDWGRAEALPLVEGIQRCFGKSSPGGV